MKHMSDFSKTILITGGMGFMGSNLVRHLFDKYPDYQIIVLDILTYSGHIDNLPRYILDSPRFCFCYGDIRNSTLANDIAAQADFVIHMAAETHVTRSIADNLKFFETDVLGTQSVVNAVLRNNEKIKGFIHISTSEVYGTAQTPFITEDDHPLLPNSPYAAAKVGADRLVYSYWITYQIPVVIVRPFNNYGPNQHLEKVIPRFITSCLLGEQLTVHGEGLAKRDWLYVKDFCNAIDTILHADFAKLAGQVLNLGTGRDISVKEIAEMVVQRLNKPSSLISLISYTDDRPGQVFRHTASVEKTKMLTGWQAQTKFEDGLDETIEWYRSHREWWERQLWLRRIPILTKDGRKIFH